MDGYAMLWFGVFLAAYFLTKRKYTILLFLAGMGLGFLIGLIAAVFKVNSILG